MHVGGKMLTIILKILKNEIFYDSEYVHMTTEHTAPPSGY